MDNLNELPQLVRKRRPFSDEVTAIDARRLRNFEDSELLIALSC